MRPQLGYKPDILQLAWQYRVTSPAHAMRYREVTLVCESGGMCQVLPVFVADELILQVETKLYFFALEA